MTEQNGIDILCDAAGSDLLLSSLFSAPGAVNPAASGSAPSAPAPAPTPATATAPPTGTPTTTGILINPTQAQQLGDHDEQSRVKRAKTDPASTPISSSVGTNHVCHLCKKVYERADHLTRHMRSHENARQYQCSRCQKRFNRADLLTRHEATHDRDANGKGRVIIRLRDRAAEACHNCAASKAKCDDQKPCSRCRNKGIPCETTPKRTLQDRPISNANTSMSPSSYKDAPAVTPDARPGSYAIPSGYGFATEPHSAGKSVTHTGVAINTQNDALIHHSMLEGIPNELMYFNPANNFFPDVDFTSWDLNFEGFAVPHFDSSHGTSPHSSVNTTTKSSRAYKDTARRHAAFKRSPWLWEPEQTDYVRRDSEAIQLNEDAVSHSLPFDRPLGRPTNRLKLTPTIRDRLFAIVLSTVNDPIHIPSFPSLELLNYLLHVHFLNDEYQCDSWLHAASFKPDDALPELLGTMIAHGASFISVPSVWQFGLALQEIVRQRIATLFETKNSNTRRLECLQIYMQNLDIGIWSGFKRRMELSESFLQPLMTMMRRAGVFTAPPDSPSIVPLASDSPEVLETKWQKFITRESYKRLVLHLFFHDVQTSVTLQKNALMSFNELSFCLPASRDLWKAPSAEAWRDNYLAKHRIPVDRPIPRITEAIHRLDLLDSFVEIIDLDLCHMALLHGFWGQILAYREGTKFYCQDDSGPKNMSSGNTQRNSTYRLLLKSQHQELYRDLSEFSAIVYATRKPPSANLAIAAELLMMILHVSLDDLQKFAGKGGEDEARRAAMSFEDEWAQTVEARYAAWHAGQVLYHTRRLAPASLKGFNAMAVYFATLTLWVYGLLSCPRPDRVFTTEHRHLHLHPHPHPHPDDTRLPMMAETVAEGSSNLTPSSTLPLVILDAEESSETRAFLHLNRGLPGLTVGRDIHHQQQQHNQQRQPQQQQQHVEAERVGVEALSNPGTALVVGRNVFRDNYPVSSEPLPPLVESLVNLLRDLGSGPAGRASRAASVESQ